MHRSISSVELNTLVEVLMDKLLNGSFSLRSVIVGSSFMVMLYFPLHPSFPVSGFLEYYDFPFVHFSLFIFQSIFSLFLVFILGARGTGKIDRPVVWIGVILFFGNVEVDHLGGAV